MSKPDYYGILGASREATEEELRDAFRRAASRAHPDREGGSLEDMQSVNEAWAVLGDPEQRAHYDRTGKRKPDDDTMFVTEMCMPALMEAIDHNPMTADIVAIAKSTLLDKANAFVARAESAQRVIHKLERTLEKLKRKRGSATLIHSMIQGAIDNAVAAKLDAEMNSRRFRRAIELLDEYEWESETPAPIVTKYTNRREWSNTLNRWVLVDLRTGIATPDPNQGVASGSTT